MRRVNMHGLGDETIQSTDLSPDNVARCSSWWYYFNPISCWGLSRDAWTQAAQFTAQLPAGSSVAAPAAPPFAYTATNPPVDEAMQESQAASDAAIRQTQSNILAAMQETGDVAAEPCTVLNIPCSWVALAGIGALALIALMTGGSHR